LHPEDVAEFIEASVEDLRARHALLEDALGVQDLVLEGTDLYIPLSLRHHPRVALSAELARELGSAQSILVAVGPLQAIQQTAYVPDLGASSQRELILQMGLDDYDGKPPLAMLLRLDRTPLPDEEWPIDPAQRGIVAGHPIYKRKFFCRPGLREFHEHEQHADEPWDGIRESTTLAKIVLPLLHALNHRFTLE
jgi:hypothetical protein